MKDLVINPGGSGGTPGGSDTQLQFNDGGSFGGADITWDSGVFTVGAVSLARTVLRTGDGDVIFDVSGGHPQLSSSTGSLNVQSIYNFLDGGADTTVIIDSAGSLAVGVDALTPTPASQGVALIVGGRPNSVGDGHFIGLGYMNGVGHMGFSTDDGIFVVGDGVAAVDSVMQMYDANGTIKMQATTNGTSFYRGGNLEVGEYGVEDYNLLVNGKLGVQAIVLDYDLQVGNSILVPPPTSLNANIVYSPSGYITNPYSYYNPYTFTYRIYTYKDIGGTIYYSSTYREASVTTDDYTYPSTEFLIDLDWASVADIDGYRIIVENNYFGASYDYFYDTTGTNASDSNDIFAAGGDVTPSSETPGFYVDAAATGNGVFKGSVTASSFYNSDGLLEGSQWTNNGTIIYYDGGLVGVGTGNGVAWTDLFSQAGKLNFDEQPLKLGRGMEISPDPGQAGITYFNQRENGLGKTYGALMAFYANAANTTAIISLGFEGDYYSSVAWNRRYMSGEVSSARPFTYANALGAAWMMDNVNGQIRGNSVNPRNLMASRIPFFGTVGAVNGLEDSATLIYTTALGAEKLNNPGFTGNANNWTLTTFTYSANTVVVNSTSETSKIVQTSANMASALVIGETYQLSFTISAHTVGGITPSCGGVTMPSTPMEAGTYRFTFTATSTADLSLLVYRGYTSGGSLSAVFTLDNISLKLVSGTMKNIGVMASTMTLITLPAAATTFAVTSNSMKVTGDAGANTIATITGGISGQELTLLFVDALVTITDTAAATADTIDLSAAFTSTANDTLTLIRDGNKWFEKSRSVN